MTIERVHAGRAASCWELVQEFCSPPMFKTKDLRACIGTRSASTSPRSHSAAADAATLDECWRKSRPWRFDHLADCHPGVDPASLFLQITALREAEQAAVLHGAASSTGACANRCALQVARSSGRGRQPRDLAQPSQGGGMEPGEALGMCLTRQSMPLPFQLASTSGMEARSSPSMTKMKQGRGAMRRRKRGESDGRSAQRGSAKLLRGGGRLRDAAR